MTFFLSFSSIYSWHVLSSTCLAPADHKSWNTHTQNRPQNMTNTHSKHDMHTLKTWHTHTQNMTYTYSKHDIHTLKTGHTHTQNMTYTHSKHDIHTLKTWHTHTQNRIYCCKKQYNTSNVTIGCTFGQWSKVRGWVVLAFCIYVILRTFSRRLYLPNFQARYHCCTRFLLPG